MIMEDRANKLILGADGQTAAWVGIGGRSWWDGTVPATTPRAGRRREGLGSSAGRAEPGVPGGRSDFPPSHKYCSALALRV